MHKYIYNQYITIKNIIIYKFMLIQISLRSYRTYSYSEIPTGITDQKDTQSFILIHHSGYFRITKGIPRPVIINE